MSYEFPLERRFCARNAGFATVTRLMIGIISFISLYFLLNQPDESIEEVFRKTESNLLFLLTIIFVIISMSFFILMIAIPLNNVFKKVNKEISLRTAQIRLAEGFCFLISIIFFLLNLPYFKQMYFFAHILYGFNLVLLGILILKSGFVNRFVGYFLMIGGITGYLIEGLVYYLFPYLTFLNYVGILIAVISELIFGIILFLKAMKLIKLQINPKETIITILKERGESTTAEIVEQAYKKSKECKDRIPNTLITLEKEQIITKKISKEKKAIVWSLLS